MLMDLLLRGINKSLPGSGDELYVHRIPIDHQPIQQPTDQPIDR